MRAVQGVRNLKLGWASEAKLWRTLLVVHFLIASASSAFPQTSTGSQREEIMNLESQRATAVVHRDTDFLDNITAGDSVRILPAGALQSKAEFLAQLKSGSVTYTSIDVYDLSVTVYGTTAVVTGRSLVQGESNGKTFGGTWRFSRVWVRKEGRWQEVLFQVTPIPGT